MPTDNPDLFTRRRAGVLLHITSLPGNGLHGHLGPEALKFSEWLGTAGITVWQMLPVGPTGSDLSPYQSCSAFAFDPSLAAAPHVAGGDIWNTDVDPESYDWPRAAREFIDAGHSRPEFTQFLEFRKQHTAWLEDYVLYLAIRSSQSDKPWHDWPVSLRDRNPDALQTFAREHAAELETYRYQQFVTDLQWQQFRHHANAQGVYLFGDVPIFVAYDSADVWAHRKLFLLDPDGAMRAVAGVPPDYFSESGQRWGQPLYDWEAHAADGFRWWIERARVQAQRFDLLRLDHFRGFSAYWQIPATAETAKDGAWIDAPGVALFKALNDALGKLPYVAENLGVITADVEKLRRKFAIPGMSVLQFGFDGNAANSNLPHNLEQHAVVYTGTHDNDTTLGWWNSLEPPDRRRVTEYLGWPMAGMPDALIGTALRSVSALAVIPMQDLLHLDSSARMNLPGLSDGNWRWRFGSSQITDKLSSRIKQQLSLYGRLL